MGRTPKPRRHYRKEAQAVLKISDILNDDTEHDPDWTYSVLYLLDRASALLTAPVKKPIK